MTISESGQACIPILSRTAGDHTARPRETRQNDIMETLQAYDLLRPLGFFTGLSPAILRDVAGRCTQVMVPAGHILFHQGEPSDSMYIVSTGRLDVTLEAASQRPGSIYEAGRGQIVGEMGILSGAPRSATVRSLRDSMLFRLSKEAFEELLELHPALTRRIAVNLSERLRQSNERVFQRHYGVKTFAIMPAGELAPTTEFTTKLIRYLGEIGSTRLITKRIVTEAVGSSDMSDSRVVHWLNEQESKYAYLIYETDLQPSAWTSRCIRQADRLLAVTRFDGCKDLNEIEQSLTRMVSESPRSHPRIDLILLHKESNFQPVNTPEWLAGRSADKHHHITSDSPKDLRRLARVLAGKAVGLVFGGGGSRGFAHIGAIRALEEAGVAIETIGGTSQGALIAAQYAMGLTPGEMIGINKVLFRDFRPLKGDRTIPVYSFLTGKTSNRGLQWMFGKRYISDLKLPFFAVSNNLSQAKVIVHRDDPVWKAVRCSMALPGLMPPVIEGGNLIVDGGVLNNLPVDIMRDHCNGAVIAVNVSPPIDLIANCEDRDNLSFWEFMRRKWFGKKDGGSIPNMLEILMRTAFLSSIHHRESMARYADLLVHPPMVGVGLLDWDKIDDLVEVGYQETRERLKHWTDRPTLRIEEPGAETGLPLTEVQA